MVRYKDYVISADGNCYVIGKVKQRKNKETGKEEEFVSAEKYCSSLSQAVSILAEIARKDFIKDNDISFCDLLSHIKDVDRQIMSALSLNLENPLPL